MRVTCLDQEHNTMSPARAQNPLDIIIYSVPVEHVPDSSLWLSWKIVYHGSPTHESLTGELTEMTADIFDSCDDASCCSGPRI